MCEREGERDGVCVLVKERWGGEGVKERERVCVCVCVIGWLVGWLVNSWILTASESHRVTS